MPIMITIPLDRKHRALRHGDRWEVQKKQADNRYITIEAWGGNRRSIFNKLRYLRIQPSVEAESKIDLLPETTGFMADTERTTQG